MKAVILAGGLGARLAEETSVRPKPMVEIGGRPILWHVMKIYAAYGIMDFVVCLGYKGYLIKEYFANYFLHMSDVTFDMSENKMEVHEGKAEPWKVTLVDTGDNTQTGGRLGRVRSYLDENTFCMTYGDGVSDLNIKTLLEFHRQHGKRATVTAVQPPGRFGAMEIVGNTVHHFLEKPKGGEGWINGGFFVLEPSVLELISGDETYWEKSPMETLAGQGQLQAFRHHGFWQPMDTMRDKTLLESLWGSGKAPWKVWS